MSLQFVRNTMIRFFPLLQMMKLVAGVLLLASMVVSRPQLEGFTPEQLLVIRQHEAIAAANAPNPLAELPGFNKHQAEIAALLRLQGVDPGQQAFDAAIARVKSQEAELAALAGRR